MPECFIVMPISTPDSLLACYSGDKDHFLHVLEHLFKPAVEKAHLTALPPIAQGADLIHAEIVKQIEEASLVLCDMSTLNPNVFFELGIRTAVDKPVCLVRDDATPKVPFDTGIVNYHTYRRGLEAWNLPAEIDALTEHLQKSLDRSKGHNSMWKYFGLSTRASLAHDHTTDGRLDLLSMQMKGVLDTLAAEPVSTTSGARIHVPPELELCNYIAWRASAERMGIAHWETVPGRVRLFTEYGKVGRLREIAEAVEGDTKTNIIVEVAPYGK